jgi:hypothetical protein
MMRVWLHVSFFCTAFLLGAPSAFFQGLIDGPDGAFNGFSTALADADFEIHFGSFNGLDNNESLGAVTVNLLTLGSASIGMNINTSWGEFFDIDSQPQDVTLNGGTVSVVPIPGAVWLFGSALGLLGWIRRKAA